MASNVFDKILDLKQDLDQAAQLLKQEKHRLVLLKGSIPPNRLLIHQCKQRIETYTLEVIRLRTQLELLDDN